MTEAKVIAAHVEGSKILVSLKPLGKESKVSGNINIPADVGMIEIAAKKLGWRKLRLDKLSPVQLQLLAQTLIGEILWDVPLFGQMRQERKKQEEEKAERLKRIKRKRGDYSMKLQLEFADQQNPEALDEEIEKVESIEFRGQKLIKKVKNFSQTSLKIETENAVFLDSEKKSEGVLKEKELKNTIIKELRLKGYKFKSYSEEG